MPAPILEAMRLSPDEIVLSETPARNAEYGCEVDGVVLRLVELQCKPSEKGAYSFFRGAA